MRSVVEGHRCQFECEFCGSRKTVDGPAVPTKWESQGDAILCDKCSKKKIAVISLSDGRFAFCDKSDLKRVGKIKWQSQWSAESMTFYAKSTYSERGIKRSRFMHRFIMKRAGKLQVDHRDNNGLNNRRSNLRIATPSQNMGNIRARIGGTSRFKGVDFDAKRNAWRAQITKDYAVKFIGYYDTENDAALAYNARAVRVFGEFAKLNQVPGLTGDELIAEPRKRCLFSSATRGVCLNKLTGRWRAYVLVDGKQKSLGRFASEQEAVDAVEKSKRSVVSDVLLEETNNVSSRETAPPAIGAGIATDSAGSEAQLAR